MKDCPHARAPPPPSGRAVAVARGRSDLGLNIPFKWLCFLPEVITMTVTICFLFSS
jgi:hypothetical protein